MQEFNGTNFIEHKKQQTELRYDTIPHDSTISIITVLNI